jgi:hypothetical protein
MAPQRRRNAIVEACAAVARLLCTVRPEVIALLQALSVQSDAAAGNDAMARHLADSADEQYLALAAHGQDKESLSAFAEARLLTAIADTFGDMSVSNHADAVYELLKACDTPSLVIGVIESHM